MTGPGSRHDRSVPSSIMASTPHPSRFITMMRGLTLRCPRCGSGKILRNWARLVDDCPRCGLHFEREPGYWTGAIAVHFTIVGGAVITTLAVMTILTLPQIPVVPTMVALALVSIVGGFISYPFSKTIWMAVDRAFLQRLDHAEAPDEQVR